MKKTKGLIISIITIAVIIITVAVVGLYLISEKQYEGGTSSHIWYYCNNGSYPSGQVGFYIEHQKDGQYHMIIASKPPQTDIVVTKTDISLFNYEYMGNGVYIKDSTSSLRVNLGGKLLQDCHKIYPGT